MWRSRKYCQCSARLRLCRALSFTSSRPPSAVPVLTAQQPDKGWVGRWGGLQRRAPLPRMGRSWPRIQKKPRNQTEIGGWGTVSGLARGGGWQGARAVAVDGQVLAARGEQRELGDHLLRELVWPVHVVAARGDDRQPVAGPVRARHHLRARLGRRVRVGRLQRGVLAQACRPSPRISAGRILAGYMEGTGHGGNALQHRVPAQACRPSALFARSSLAPPGPLLCHALTSLSRTGADLATRRRSMRSQPASRRVPESMPCASR
jgi:hypothetical protein